MTVPATARRAGPFNGNGTTTAFSFTFKTFAAGDLQVVKTSTIGIESILVLDSDYSVTLNGDQDASPGGSITYPISGSPLATGEKLTVISVLAYEQTTDLLGGGAFNARVIEDTFDRTVVQIQQLEERADRALTLPVSSAASVELPVPQASHLLVWNASANAIQNLNPANLLSIINDGVVGLQSGVTQPATSGTSIEFTSIPAWAKRIRLQLFGLSTDGTSRLLVQLGTASGWVTSGYASAAMYNSGISGAFNSASNGFLLEPTNVGSAFSNRAGIVTLEVADGARWVYTAMTYPVSSVLISSAAGRHEVTGVTKVRILADNGTDTFDAGHVGITFE